MGRSSAILGVVVVATAVVVGLASRIGADDGTARMALDLAAPRVLAAESAPGFGPGSGRGPAFDPAASTGAGRSGPPLTREPSPAAPPRIAAASPPRRVAADASAPFEQAELHEAVDGTEVPTGLVLVRTVAAVEDTEEPVPLAGVRVAAYVPGKARVTTPVDDHAGDLERSPRSNREGLVELVLPAGVDLRLVTTGDEAGARSGSVEVEALSDGETRELELEVETVAGRLLELALVDAETGAPIADAELRRVPPAWLGPAQSWGSSGELAATTDQEGAAVLDRRELAGSRVRVVAPSYGPATFAPGALPDDATLRLTRTARLDVQVKLTSPEDSEAVVRLSTPAAALSLTGEKRLGRPDVEWRMHLDLGGYASFPHLPADVPLVLEVELGDELRHRAAQPIVLAPGGREDHALELGAGVVLHGALRDEDGRPVANTEIWLVAASERGPAFLDGPEAARRVAGRATTDAAGGFRLAAVPAGEWWVGPAPPLRSGDPDAPAPFARWIRVPAGGGSFGLDLRADRGLYLEGRARGGPQDSPRVEVEARLVGTGALTSARCDDEGRFRIGPLTPGTYEVAARPDAESRHAGSRAQLAEPGDPVELVLLPGRVLVVRGLDSAGVSAALGRVRWTRSDVGPFAVGEHRLESGASSVFVSGLDVGTYDVFAAAADGRVGTTPDVRVESGRPPRDVRVPLLPAARLTLENGGTEAFTYEAFLGRCSIAVGEVEPGDDALLLAPPGEVRIRYATEGRASTEECVTLGQDAREHLVLGDSTH